jgi:anti-sigma factor RsiW
MSDHERWNDTAAAYVLGAMAVAEREEFEAHLSTCEICREEVDELRPAAEALPMASPLMVPSGRSAAGAARGLAAGGSRRSPPRS